MSQTHLESSGARPESGWSKVTLHCRIRLGRGDRMVFLLRDTLWTSPHEIHIGLASEFLESGH